MVEGFNQFCAGKGSGYHNGGRKVAQLFRRDTVRVGYVDHVATFRGEKSTVRAGETLSIPANAPHSFTNASKEIVRLLCLCAPAGQEEFFAQVGVPVATRTTMAPKLDKDEQAAFMQKAKDLMPKYRTEMVKPGPIEVIGKLFK